MANKKSNTPEELKKSVEELAALETAGFSAVMTSEELKAEENIATSPKAVPKQLSEEQELEKYKKIADVIMREGFGIAKSQILTELNKWDPRKQTFDDLLNIVRKVEPK